MKRFVSLAAVASLVVAPVEAAFAQPAPVPNAAQADPNLATYFQLVVQVKYGEASDMVDLTACPTGEVFKSNFEQFLNSSQTLALGITVNLPDGKKIDIAPNTVSVKSPPAYQVFKKTKCNAHIGSSTYVSPIYLTADHLQDQFKVAPLLARTTGLPDDFVNAGKEIAEDAAKLSTVTAPFASQVGIFVSRALGGLGTNLSNEVPGCLSMDARLCPAERSWKVRKEQFGGSADIVVSARLNAIGSVYDPGHAAPPSTLVTNNNVGNLLTRTFYANPIAEARNMIGLAKFANPTALSNFQTKPLPKDASDACFDLQQSLMTQGLSDGDAALLTWAIGRARTTAFSDNSSFDRLDCLRSHAATLKQVGVTFSEKVDPVLVAANTEQMSGALTFRPPGSDDSAPGDITAFAKIGDLSKRSEAAARLFSSRPKVVDTAALAFKGGSRTLDDNHQWTELAYDPVGPLFENLGCYTYFDFAKTTALGGSGMIAAGRTPDGNSRPQETRKQDVWVIFAFEPVDAGAARAKVGQISIRRDAPDGAMPIIQSQYPKGCQSFDTALLPR